MTTATLPLVSSAARSARTKDTSAPSRAGAAILSVTGTIVAIGIAALGLLIVPAAALVVFGPALLDLVR